MRILLTAVPGYGHVNPMVPLALACRAAGHDVVFAVGAPFDALLPVRTRSLSVSADSVQAAAARARGRMIAGEAPDDVMPEMFGADLADPTLEALLPVLEDERPDLMVVDQIDPGAGVAAVRLGIPFAWFANTSPHPATAACRAFTFSRHGVSTSQQPALDPTLPCLLREEYPDDFAPVPLRPEPWSHETALPGWLDEPADRPRVLLTLGTEFNDAATLGRAARSIAAQHVEVLLALGPRLDAADLGEVPERVHVERFVAQHLALARIDAVVHHGGSGTVVGAAANGVPQVVLPQGADQFWNARRLTELGAGIQAGSDGADVGEAVADVVTQDSSHREAARTLHAEWARMPATEVVVDRLAELF